VVFKHAFVLTGSIASGKSTVSRLLELDNFKIIDADLVAREQLKLHTKEVIELFGNEICENGIINRKMLAKIIFNSKTQKEKLNFLLHPFIREEITKKANVLERLAKPYIIDIPLFFEGGKYDCQMSVVVYSPYELQLKRLMRRDEITKNDAQKKIASQIDIEQKKKMADWVIDNSSSLKHLENETKKFINFVREKYANIKI